MSKAESQPAPGHWLYSPAEQHRRDLSAIRLLLLLLSWQCQHPRSPAFPMASAGAADGPDLVAERTKAIMWEHAEANEGVLAIADRAHHPDCAVVDYNDAKLGELPSAVVVVRGSAAGTASGVPSSSTRSSSSLATASRSRWSCGCRWTAIQSFALSGSRQARVSSASARLRSPRTKVAMCEMGRKG